MNLDEAQKRIVAEWVAQGQKLSEIQKRIADELGLHLTYMEVRLLVDDLKLTPRDVEPPKSIGAALQAAAPGSGVDAPAAARHPAAKAGAVSISVDQVARPGAVVSGKVTFSDA